jgi:hypothetical protein
MDLNRDQVMELVRKAGMEVRAQEAGMAWNRAHGVNKCQERLAKRLTRQKDAWRVNASLKGQGELEFLRSEVEKLKGTLRDMVRVGVAAL